MSVIAISKNVQISPRKVGMVAGIVRGQSVDNAVIILDHTPRRAAIAIKKTILSAKANAIHNHNYLAKGLEIKEINISPGMTLKRYRPAARGRALPFRKRYSHIRVVIDGQVREKKTSEAAKTPAKENK
jgi:large subunit ribosomal protein L22